jgi:hypothetical protein
VNGGCEVVTAGGGATAAATGCAGVLEAALVPMAAAQGAAKAAAGGAAEDATEGSAKGAVAHLEKGCGSCCEPAATEVAATVAAAGASVKLVKACFLLAVAVVAAERLYLAGAHSRLAVVWSVTAAATAAAAEPAVVAICILMPQQRGVLESSGIHSLMRPTP